jgi:TnpA family transposase
LVFALFDLVGIEFAPRIRDIKNQWLSKIKSSESPDRVVEEVLPPNLRKTAVCP